MATRSLFKLIAVLILSLSSPAWAEHAAITSTPGNDLPLGAAGQTGMWLKQDQNVLISTSSGQAKAKLDVDGSVRIGADAHQDTCAPGTNRGGTLSFLKKNPSDATGALWLCDGTKWVNLSCPTLTHGQQVFTYMSGVSSFTPPSGTSASCPLDVRILIVGGGANGTQGTDRGGNGGNGGNILAVTGTLTSAAAIPVTVGGAGGDSSFGALVARGGIVAPGGSAGGAGGAAGGPPSQNQNGFAGGFVSASLSAFKNVTITAGTGGAGGAKGVDNTSWCPSYIYDTCTPFRPSDPGQGGNGYGAGGGGGGGWGGFGQWGAGGGGGGAGGLMINGVGAAGSIGLGGSGGGGGAGGAGAPGVVYLEW